MLANIWVKDKTDGQIHQVGTDTHDSLIFIDGKVEYYNMQNGEGTGDRGDYEFVEPPDFDDYVVVTPDELRLNRELLHKALEKKLVKKRKQKKKQEKKALKK